MAFAIPSQDLSVLMEEAEASLTSSSFCRFILLPNSCVSVFNDPLLCSPTYPFQRSSKMVKCLANPWWKQRLMTGRTLGMPMKWARRSTPPIAERWRLLGGLDHITTIPEDYAQHVILGVHLITLSTKFLLIQCLSFDDSSFTSGCYLFQALRLLRLATHLES